MLRIGDYDSQRTMLFVLVTGGCVAFALGVWYGHRVWQLKRFPDPTPAPQAEEPPQSEEETPRQSESLLAIDQEVEIFGLGELEGFCMPAVLAHRDDDLLVLRLFDDTPALPWQAGDSVKVYFWRPQDAGYLFETEIVETRLMGQGYLVVAPPEHLERQQRRLDVRVPVEVPVDFLRIPAGNVTAQLGARGALLHGVLEDLSAGGSRLRTDAPLDPEDYVCISQLPGVPGEDILCRVVSTGDPEQAPKAYGVRFVGLSAAARDQIRRHVFRLQRESLAAGRTHVIT